MKQTYLVAAIALLAAGTVSAQSSVTIYGRLNMSLENQKNIGAVGTQKVMQNNASRLGFKGVEDLGGGLKAEFYLEHRFNADTGTVSGAFWAGDSYVGLSGGFGSIKLGRLTSAAYYATADYISFHNHDTGVSADALYTYLTNGTNTISYTSPSFGGLTVEATVSAAEGSAITNKVANLALNYSAGKFEAGFGYERVAGTRDEQMAVRANYSFGPAVLGAYYQRSNLKSSLGKRDAYRFSGLYTMGASEFHLNYGMADDWSRLNNSDANQLTVAYGYNLSKRTKVYTFYTQVDNSRNFTYLGSGTGQKASSVAVGVRHNF
jgi:predicted porin